MKRPVTISLSPNAEPSDIRRAYHALFHPRIARDEQLVTQAAQSLSDRFVGRSVVLTSSGRSALLATWQALGIRSGDEIILQAFTCIAVPETIIWAGAKPIYADIIPGTYNIDPDDVVAKVGPRTKAIIVQHTFGIPGPIDRLRQITADRDIALIEDCAHALGSRSQERLLGTLGDVAILSFGRDKAISSVFGGAVVSANQPLMKKVAEQQQRLPYPPPWWLRQQLLHPILFDLVVPLYFTARLGQAYIALFQKLHLLSKAVQPREKTGGQPAHIGYRYSPALAYLLQAQLAKLDRYIERRRAIGQRYLDELGQGEIAIPLLPPDAQPAWLRWPVEVPEPNKILDRALGQHMLLGDWYTGPLAPSDCDLSAFGYVPGSCPWAEYAAAHTINLPTYPLLTDDQVDAVIRFIRNFQ